MANYLNKYLRQAGIKTPYTDLTEAQIEEKGKLNPLGGYGFMSAAEKNQRKQQNDLYQQQMDRENEWMQQQLLARMSSQGQIGHHMGSGLMGLVDQLKNKGQAPEVPNVAMDDPELQQYAQMASTPEMGGPLQAKLMLGQQLLQKGDVRGAQMIQDARKEAMEQKKAGLDVQKLDQEVNDPNKNFEHKPGFTDEEDVDLPNGLPGIRKRTLLQNTPDGGIWHIGKPAMKGTVAGASDTFGNKSKTDNSKTVDDFEIKMTSTANAFDHLDKMDAIIDDGTMVGGWAATLIRGADDILEGVKGLAVLAADFDDEGRGGAYNDIEKYKFGALEKSAQNSSKVKALVLELAAARAAAVEPGGRFTEGDIQRQIEQIGGDVSNPRTFKALLGQARETMFDSLKNQARYMTSNGTPVGEKYAAQIAEFEKRLGRKKAEPSTNDMEAKRKRYDELKEKQRQRQLNGTATQP